MTVFMCVNLKCYVVELQQLLKLRFKGLCNRVLKKLFGFGTGQIVKFMMVVSGGEGGNIFERNA